MADASRRLGTGYASLNKRHWNTYNKARNHFIGVLRASISRSDLVADEIEGIERILEGYIPLKKDVYTSTCFGFDIYKDQCISISSFYRTDIETGKNRNFRFIASPTFFDASNQGAPQGFAYLLYDLLKWLREFSYEKLAHFTELEQQKNFNIALHFANGNIQKWKSEGMSYRKIAQHIDRQS